ncbi:MAG: glycosyltransferase [Bacteroidetes bacterium]|nr:glycosyltransferase [Bacteroidota bacterium]
METQSNNIEKQVVVTVISLCYNTGSRFVNTLESIRTQSYQDIEHIIIDDGSTDDSVVHIKEWIDKHDYKCKLIINEKNRGICPTANIAMREASGKYISLIGDDIMLPDKIKDDVLYMEQHRAFGFCHSNIRIFYENGNDGPLLKPHHSENFFCDFISWKNFVYTPTIFYRKEVFEKVGLFDEDLSFEDMDMILRVSYEYKVGYRDAETVKYFRPLIGYSEKRSLLMKRDLFKILAKWNFLKNYQYIIARWNLALLYNTSSLNKKLALKYLPKAMRFFYDKRFMRAVFNIVFK